MEHIVNVLLFDHVIWDYENKNDANFEYFKNP